jgi:hypothetical protein
MDEGMKKGISEAITKHLSTEVGAALQAELKELERYRLDYPALAKESAAQKVENARLAKVEQGIESRECAVAIREAAVSAVEKKIFEAELRQKTAEEKVAFAGDLLKTVFANNVVKSSRFGSVALATSYPGGGSAIQTAPTSETEERIG